eukprot:Awhi_evm3s770
MTSSITRQSYPLASSRKIIFSHKVITTLATILIINFLVNVEVVEGRRKYFLNNNQHLQWKQRLLAKRSTDVSGNNNTTAAALNVTEYCRMSNSNSTQGWEWAYHCSIASQNFTFFNDETEEYQNAIKGNIH